jgi:hypothetical protein
MGHRQGMIQQRPGLREEPEANDRLGAEAPLRAPQRAGDRQRRFAQASRGAPHSASPRATVEGSATSGRATPSLNTAASEGQRPSSRCATATASCGRT